MRSKKNKYEIHIKNNIKNGRGSGRNEKYKGWIVPWEMSSKGRLHEVSITRTGGNRKHVFLSDLEQDYSLYYNYQPETIDVREQFPLLDRDMTLLIASELGVKHPVYPDGKTPIVMTTDLVIDFIDKNDQVSRAVRSVKYYKELEKLRVREKLAIEQEYFLRKFNISNWAIITERDLDSRLRQNLNIINDCLDIRDNIFYYSFLDSELELMKIYFKSLYETRGRVDSFVYQGFESEFNLEQGAGRIMFKHLLANREIVIDLTQPLDFW